MAKDTKNGQAATVARAPEGLARVGSVANAPWWNLRAGNVLDGKLLNIFERPDERAKGGKSKFFQIELTIDTEVRSGKGKDAKVGVAKAGEVINLNYGPKTKELEKFIPDIMRGAEYRVWAFVEGEKFDIGKGQTMWPIDVRAGMTRPAMASEDPDFSDADENADQE